MKVPYNYLPMQFCNTDDIFAEWRELIESTDFTLGKYVAKFEGEFAGYIKSKHCIATNNGTDALILGLKALGIGYGDEVITVCNSFYATTGAIVAVGAIPIMVDSDDRYQICVDAIERKITSKTKAILPVHWAGASPDMSAIVRIADKNNLVVLEDACMGIGGKFDGKNPGTFGKCGAYSLHPLKTLNVMGDGGMVVTDDDALASWMRMYRNHGMIDRDHNVMWGVNMRMQPLQAIVASFGLKDLDRVINVRNENAVFLDSLLSRSELEDFVKIPVRSNRNVETQSLYMGLFEQRDELIKYLSKNEIEAKIHYPIPLHLQAASKPFGYKAGDFPTAEYQAGKLVTLPIHQFLTRHQIRFVAETISSFYLGN
jgi:dTDP-4-amino-4,6-dideoxygalactose transaminase